MSIFNFKKEEKSHWETMLKEAEIHMAYYQKGLEEQEQIVEFLKQQVKEMTNG